MRSGTKLTAASGDNYATSLIQTSDGGYAVAGYTDASGAGGYDFYLIKTTSTGAISTSSAFNWDSLEGFLIIGAIIFIVVGRSAVHYCKNPQAHLLPASIEPTND